MKIANASIDPNNLDENLLQGNPIAKCSSVVDKYLYCHCLHLLATSSLFALYLFHAFSVDSKNETIKFPESTCIKDIIDGLSKNIIIPT